MEYFCCGGIGWHWVELRSIISSIRSSKRFAVQYLKHFIDVFTFCEKNSEKKNKKMRCIFSLTNSFCVACAMTCVIRNSLASVIYIYLCLYWNKREKLKPHETTTPTDQINIRFEFELVWLLTNSVNGSYRVNCSTLKLSHILIISVITKNKATIH